MGIGHGDDVCLPMMSRLRRVPLQLFRTNVMRFRGEPPQISHREIPREQAIRDRSDVDIVSHNTGRETTDVRTHD